MLYSQHFSGLVEEVYRVFDPNGSKKTPKGHGWPTDGTSGDFQQLPWEAAADISKQLLKPTQLDDDSRAILRATYLHEVWLGESDPALIGKLNTSEITTALFEGKSKTSPDQLEDTVRRSATGDFPDSSVKWVACKMFNIYASMMRLLGSHDPLTTTLIKEVHALIGKDLIDGAGEYRNVDVAPSGSITPYLARGKVARRMEDLVTAFQSEWVKSGDDLVKKIVAASVFFSEFLLTHPFRNGNGRVARLLLNYILRKEVIVPFTLCGHFNPGDSPPQVTYQKERRLYLRVLEARYDKTTPPSLLTMYIFESILRTRGEALFHAI